MDAHKLWMLRDFIGTNNDIIEARLFWLSSAFFHSRTIRKRNFCV